ncbi:MAG: hypothetical protein Q7J72_03780 [Candidatus Omnitrophota bacterium]|nr:hypothetical protein [Candidatus Omnitrophota bacterium]
MPHKSKKIVSLILCLLFILQQSGLAQSIRVVDISQYLGSKPPASSPEDTFRPVHLRYLSYDNLNNNFKLLLDQGAAQPHSLPAGRQANPALEQVTNELLKYFFIGLTLPNSSFWVNLRPDAPDNIIDENLAKTDIGKILLEADLNLKKDTSNLTSPQTSEGKAYWDKLYQKAGELFGTENITIPTITRPWIVPDEIIIRESPGTSAYIYKATLKVMLEEDYLKSSQLSAVGYQQYEFKDQRLKELNQYSTQLIKELIIPKLTREINSSKRYASLRQVYYSLIFAQHFKKKFSQSTGENPYVKLIDSRNLTNLTSKEPWDKRTYFNDYQKSFQQGEYNLKATISTAYGQAIRSYMSGGVMLDMASSVLIIPTKREPTFVSSALVGPITVEGAQNNFGAQGIVAHNTYTQSAGGRAQGVGASSSAVKSEKESAFNRLAEFHGKLYTAIINIILDDISDEQKQKEIDKLLNNLDKLSENVITTPPGLKDRYITEVGKLREAIEKNRTLLGQHKGNEIQFLAPLFIKGVHLNASKIKGFISKAQEKMTYKEYAGIPFLEVDSQYFEELMSAGFILEGARAQIVRDPLVYVVTANDASIDVKKHELHHAIWYFMRKTNFMQKVNEVAPGKTKAFNNFRDEICAYILSGQIGEIKEVKSRNLVYTEDKKILEIASQTQYFLNNCVVLARMSGIADTDFLYPAMRSRNFEELKENFRRIIDFPIEAVDILGDLSKGVDNIVRSFKDKRLISGLKEISAAGYNIDNTVKEFRKHFNYFSEILEYYQIAMDGLPIEITEGLIPLDEKNLSSLMLLSKQYPLRIPLSAHNPNEFVRVFIIDNISKSDLSANTGKEFIARLEYSKNICKQILNNCPQIKKAFKEEKGEIIAALPEVLRGLYNFTEEGIIILKDFIISLKNDLDSDGDSMGGLKNEESSSALTTEPSRGGIDLTVLPIATQSLLNQPLTANMPIASSALNLNLNLDKELQEIQDMLKVGIMPSSERIKECALASSSLKPEGYSREIDRLLGCIADIFRLEEEKAKPTPQILKDVLILLESDKPTQELQLELDGFKS